ncbi:hypothetical protein C5467_23015 [Photorhabdus khanii subsp. guanajuatensis]|uniref:Uncharacterized protein n=1 Tax=Photorhabdus khanii subsp. guanajuatensis TaxID=2100166 RepID=A0A4R4IV61_9GAMM|nr:hypothetical protein C5467_23015 [Photorhabdus khanii subsp. guanajuatensis]
MDINMMKSDNLSITIIGMGCRFPGGVRVRKRKNHSLDKFLVADLHNKCPFLIRELMIFS